MPNFFVLSLRLFNINLHFSCAVWFHLIFLFFYFAPMLHVIMPLLSLQLALSIDFFSQQFRPVIAIRSVTFNILVILVKYTSKEVYYHEINISLPSIGIISRNTERLRHTGSSTDAARSLSEMFTSSTTSLTAAVNVFNYIYLRNSK